MAKVEVEEQDLRNLIAGAAENILLHNGGVDNWDWYGDSLEELSELEREMLAKYGLSDQ